jgi:phosphate starvation-inducible PhoH-like protein
MKMFLTRMGEGTRMAITGDPSQVDLPPGQKSGLVEAAGILEGTPGIGFVRFNERDVVRHPLVARIVSAYNRAEQHRTGEPRPSRRGMENDGTGK